MLIGLWLGLCAAIFMMFVYFFKTMTITVFKVLAFAIDYFVLVFYAVYYFNEAVTTKLVSGNWIYLVNTFIGLVTIFLYTMLIQLINEKVPAISTLLNLVMAFIGVTIAVPFTISLIAPIIGIFKPGFTFNGDIILSHNHIKNLIYTNLLFAVITIPVWQYRMNKLNREA
ncbi:MAG: hypothetical protein GX359_00845 [Clostridiales bacterium]|nr:hypothetical protein [Clostridiales bacterium]